MDSIQSLISEHMAILLEQYYLFHFRGYPIEKLSLEVKAERIPELGDTADLASTELVGPVISALHQMNKNNRKTDKKQKQFNLQLEEVT